MKGKENYLQKNGKQFCKTYKTSSKYEMSFQMSFKISENMRCYLKSVKL